MIGLNSKTRLVGAVAALSLIAFGIGYAVAAQPHMENALNDLRAAHNELQSAVADKGGHRAKAIQLVEAAIGQVNAGIAFAASH